MSQAVVIFLTLLLISSGMVSGVWLLLYRLTPEKKRNEIWGGFLNWGIKGLGVPMFIWMLMNIGISWNLQPFMPEIQVAQASGTGWFPEYLDVLGVGAFILSSYWSALTLLMILVRARAGMQPEVRGDFRALCWTCFLALLVPALIVLLLGGWPFAGVAAGVILFPLAGYAPRILNPRPVPPIYARALARMKFGKYSEAEWEIIRELEKCEEDFDGWMMLAELYANQFKDLREAEKTIMGICDQPTTTASQMSVALHKLADWQLKLAGDPDLARWTLQLICDRLKGTHLARMAQLRMNQLPKSVKELREQQSGKPIPLPAMPPLPSFASTPEGHGSTREEAGQAANACVALLNQDPNDIAAREKLARIFAEQLDKPELGIEQLGLLLDMPSQPDAKRAEWLELLAAWHIQYREDAATGRKFLSRIIDEFPRSPEAFAAQRRLFLLEAEERAKVR